MKRTLISIGCALAFGMPATNASATDLAYADVYYVGHVLDGIPSNPADQVVYINNLIGLAAGATETQIPETAGEKYDRVGSTLDISFPTALSGVKNATFSFSGIDVTAFTYIIAKYDAESAGSYVWYVPDLTEVSIPLTIDGQHGLSHYTLVTAAGVPDGGATLMLLGGALVGLGALRRRFWQ